MSAAFPPLKLVDGVLLASYFVCLSSFGVVLRFCVGRRCDSSSLLVVIVLSWGCSSFVVVALPVMSFSSLSLKSSAVVVGRHVGLVELRACSWCVWSSVYRVFPATTAL